MKKQNYSKPFMVAEKFIPDDFVTVCTAPGNFRIYAPNIENNNLEGWQTHQNTVDGTIYQKDYTFENYWWIYFDDQDIMHVGQDTYAHDNESNYWQNTLKTPGIMIHDHNGTITKGEIIPAGTIIYKNQGNSVYGGAQLVEGGKNHS